MSERLVSFGRCPRLCKVAVIVSVFVFIFGCSKARATAIDHFSVSQNSIQSMTSSFVTVSGMSIASGSFTTGKKYLIVATAQTTAVAGCAAAEVKLRHGATDFGLSAQNINHCNVNVWATYGFMTVWTAVASEGIDMQVTSASSDGKIDQAHIQVINLSDDLVENTDWFTATESANTALSATPGDGCSITFTPGSAGKDWLVLVSDRISTGNQTTAAIISNLSRSGEASSSTPSWRVRSSSGTLRLASLHARVFNLGASSNTFKEQAAMESGTSGARTGSTCFALNLSKFNAHGFAYTDADFNLNTSAYGDQIQTATVTPTATTDIWILATWGFDFNNVSRRATWRVQLDGDNDLPAGQTTDAYTFQLGDVAADEQPLALNTIATSQTAASHTIDLEGSVDSTTGTPAGQYRQVVAVSMELGGAAFSNRPQVIIVLP